MLLETVFVILSAPPIEEEMPNLKQFPLELSQIKNWKTSLNLKNG